MEPLLLRPIFVERVWGGSALRKLFGKDLPSGRAIGESWEAADFGNYVSVAAGGQCEGRTLRELSETWGVEQLFGEAATPEGRMPLLFKLIDARQDLSVQLHPRDRDVDPASGERGKEEAWYILNAERGAGLVHGLKEGVSAEQFYAAVAEGWAERLLKWWQVSPGEVYYIPPGAIHAIGKGIVLAEIQQSSDTTYRIYDWGRAGLDGKPRQLHIEEAARVPLASKVPCPYASPGTPGSAEDGELLVKGDHFRMVRYRLNSGSWIRGAQSGDFALFFVVDGEARLLSEAGRRSLLRGQTWLLPAQLGGWSIQAAKGWTALWFEPGG